VKLTTSERHYLARRRAGVTQREWGARHGVLQYLVSLMEDGRLDKYPVPVVKGDELTIAERSTILRRRTGLTRRQAAEALGYHVITIRKYERNGNEGYLAWCEDLGK